MQVIKRNGEVVDFEEDKISNAILKAMDETEIGEDFPLALEIRDEITELAYNLGEDLLTVEEIQDLVEEKLAEKGRFDVAKQYIIYRRERTEKRDKGWEMNELQETVWNEKYRYKNESFSEFLDRVSGGNSEVRKLIQNKDFLFGGRILAGRGIDRKVSLANCTTLPPIEDSIEGIFKGAGELARMFSYGQGAGIDISKLRPRGAKVNNASKTSTGAVSFMEIFDSVGNVIGAEGRRSALLIMLDALHPDISEFIHVKSDTTKINNANLSVKATNEFMELDTPRKLEILEEISNYAWDNGEPAMLFIDNTRDFHLLSEDEDYEIVGYNACTEFSTTAYGTCLLGSLNIANFILDPYTDRARIDFDRLSKVSRTATIGLNEALLEAIPTHPLTKQREVASNYRQIGLGVMGLGSAFIKLGIEYGSPVSVKCVGEIMETIRDNTIYQSTILSSEKGSYPKYDYDKISKSSYFKSLPAYLRAKIKRNGLYNSTFLSVAPAGTISLLADVTNGLEPLFALSYDRTTKSLGATDRVYKVYPKEIGELMKHLGISEEGDLPKYCITAHQIDPIKRIDIQSKMQEYVDLAISSTINLDESVTPEEISEIYKYAHSSKLKGVSVFRNNCARIGILTVDNPKEDETVELDCQT